MSRTVDDILGDIEAFRPSDGVRLPPRARHRLWNRKQ
jgi:hypothetical protein